jgi:hypothetical protein
MSNTPPTEARRRLPPWLLQGAVLALVGALIAWAVGFLPNPFADDDPSGEVTIGQTLRNQTLAMFHGQATEPRDGEQLGLTLDVARSAEHVEANGCRLVWTFVNADGPTPVADKSLVSQEARDVAPDPSSCTTQTRLWVPLAASLVDVQNLAVRVELFAGDHLLASAVSETIPLG